MFRWGRTGGWMSESWLNFCIYRCALHTARGHMLLMMILCRASGITIWQVAYRLDIIAWSFVGDRLRRRGKVGREVIGRKEKYVLNGRGRKPCVKNKLDIRWNALMIYEALVAKNSVLFSYSKKHKSELKMALHYLLLGSDKPSTMMVKIIRTGSECRGESYPL